MMTGFSPSGSRLPQPVAISTASAGTSPPPGMAEEQCSNLELTTVCPQQVSSSMLTLECFSHVVWVVPVVFAGNFYYTVHGYFSRGDVPYTIHEWGNPVIFPVYIYIYPNSLRPSAFGRYPSEAAQDVSKSAISFGLYGRSMMTMSSESFCWSDFVTSRKNSQSISFQYG